MKDNKDFLNNTKFQYYKGGITHNEPLGFLSLNELLEEQVNSKNEALFNKISDAEKEGNVKLKAQLKQDNLRFYTPCVIIGDFHENGYKSKVKNKLWRDYAHIKEFTGLFVLDFDHLKKHNIDAVEFRNNLFDNYNSLIASWVSPSKNGVKAIMKIPVCNDVLEFQRYASAIKKEMQKYISEIYSHEASIIYDPVGKNPVQPLFQSYDPTAIFSNTWEIWTKQEEQQKEMIIKEVNNKKVLVNKETVFVPNDFTPSPEEKQGIKSLMNYKFNQINSASGGHPNVVKIARAFGGYVGYGYFTEQEAVDLCDSLIDNNSYLVEKADKYKQTARDLISIGIANPLKYEQQKKDCNTNIEPTAEELKDVIKIQSIIDNLPPLLKDSCNIFTDEIEKEVFLLGALGVVSGLLPKIKGKYRKDWIESNLFVYLIGNYGGGKGGLKYARNLAYQINDAKKKERVELYKQYADDLIIYKKELSIFNKDKKASKPPEKPKEPKMTMLYIPVNNSKSGVYQLLEDNKGRGVMFETEGDTLSDALKQDYGSYSDLLRKAFHHEPLEFFRRLNNEIVEIEKPYLSVVLSSTNDQLKTLIPSTENGLYSRFLYYYLKEEKKFLNVFNDDTDYSGQVLSYGAEFKKMYDYLISLETPIFFRLPKGQQSKFNSYFENKKASIIEGISPTMAGTVNRFGVIAFRLMMIFTALRHYSNNNLSGTIYCNDKDYKNALEIIEKLEEHAISVYEYLGETPDKKELALKLRKTGASIRDIEKAVKINRGTLSKWFNKRK